MCTHAYYSPRYLGTHVAPLPSVEHTLSPPDDEGGPVTMRKIIAASALALVLAITSAGAASADPAFGPGAANGEGNNEPHENAGTKCHPPGQTVEVPGCK